MGVRAQEEGPVGSALLEQFYSGSVMSEEERPTRIPNSNRSAVVVGARSGPSDRYPSKENR